MKKLVSLLVIVTMMLTAMIAIIPASAASDGTLIDGNIAVSNMTADGNYYLDGDIEISSGFSGEFKGTFDGKGHTVTITGGGPLFKNVKGATIKNVTVAGTAVVKTSNESYGGVATEITDAVLENVTVSRNITYQGFENFTSYVGGIAARAGGTVTFTNVKNTGAISINTNGEKAKTYEKPEIGGFIGKTNGKATLVFTDCENAGAVKSIQTQVNVGGFVGFVNEANISMFDCKNTADLVAMSDENGGFVGLGGFIGRTDNRGSKDYAIILSGCVNNGNLSDADPKHEQKGNLLAGGMIGRLYSVPNLTINSCVNNGNISITKCATSTWGGVGGIIGGYITIGCRWDKLKQSESLITNCLNTGKIEGAQPAGIVGGNFMQVQIEDFKLVVEYCVNTGEIKGAGSSSKAGGILSGIAYEAKTFDWEGKDTSCSWDQPRLSDVVIRNCKNEGKISNASLAGGIVGNFPRTTGLTHTPEITNCVNTGEITASTMAGGIMSDSGVKVKVSGCINKGTVTANSKFGIINDSSLAEATNNFYLTGGAAGSKGTGAAAGDIDTKISALKFQMAHNDMKLAFVIETAEKLSDIDYSAASWTPFKNALTAAKNAIANLDAPQATIDSAETALADAMAGLVRKDPSLTDLNAKLTEAKSKKRGDYNSNTYAALEAAIEAAEKDMARDDVLQSEINAHVKAIDDAIKALKKRGQVATLPSGGLEDIMGGNLYDTGEATEEPTETETETNAPTSTVAPTEPAEEEGGCGSVIGGAAVALVAVAAIGAGLVLKKKED